MVYYHTTSTGVRKVKVHVDLYSASSWTHL